MPPPPPLSPASSESLSDTSEPPLSLSLISVEANFLDALGDAGGGRRLHTWTWISSHSLRKRRRLPKPRPERFVHLNFRWFPYGIFLFFGSILLYCERLYTEWLYSGTGNIKDGHIFICLFVCLFVCLFGCYFKLAELVITIGTRSKFLPKLMSEWEWFSISCR